jgi:hypothetical protein
MQQSVEARREAQDDIFHGQIVIIVARWFLILAGVVLALWSADNVSEVIAPIVFMIVLMIINFYLHARYLLHQPINALMVYLSSAVDLVIVTLIILVWTQGRGPGLPSPFFIFLYPTLLAFALVFPPRITLVYTALTVAVYVAFVFLGSGILDLADQKTLLQRVVTLLATAGLGTYFWRIQRARRRAARQRSDLVLRHALDPRGLTS